MAPVAARAGLRCPRYHDASGGGGLSVHCAESCACLRDRLPRPAAAQPARMRAWTVALLCIASEVKQHKEEGNALLSQGHFRAISAYSTTITHGEEVECAT